MMRAISVLSLLSSVACGDSLTPNDAGELAGDASDVELVHVRVRGDLGPGGLPVYFQRRDSSLQLATLTDAAGHANGYVSPGGFVTVVIGKRLLTYVDVQPGDQLAFEHWENLDALATTSVRVRVPERPNAVSYRLYTSCGVREIFGAQLQPLDISLGDCGAAADMLATATVSTGGFAWVFQGEVPVDGSPSINFVGPYQPEVLARITAVSIPAQTDLVLGSQSLIRGSDEVLPARATAMVAVNGSATATVTMPMPGLATMSTHLEAPSLGGIGGFHVIEWRPATADVEVSYNRDRVRSYRESPRYVAETSEIVWSENLDGAVADGVLAELSWTDARLVRRDWLILSPRTDAARVRLPVLPALELRPLEATAAVLTFDSFRIEGGFDRARTAFRLGRPLRRGMWFTDGPEGRVVYQGLD